MNRLSGNEAHPASDYPYLRPTKGAIQNEVRGGIAHRREGLTTTEFTGVRLSPLGQLSRPFGYSPDLLLVDDNDFCTLCESCDETPTPGFETGVYLFGGYLRKIWGHFMMGGTGRLWPVAGGGQKVDGVIFFAHDAELLAPGGNYLELLKLAGVADKMHIFFNEDIVVGPEATLIVPEISFEHDKVHSDECSATFDFIRTNALKHTPAAEHSPEKVFFTRSGLKNAASDEVNLRLLDRFFSDNGYTVVSPEKLSLSEMVRLLAGVREFASVSGSTAHNIVFAPPMADRRVTIIERHAWVNTFQTNINLMCGIEAHMVDAFRMPVFSTSQGFVFLYGFTDELAAYARDMRMDVSAFASCGSISSRRRELRRYLRRYRRYYGNSQALEPWEVEGAASLAEAVVEAREYYGRWLVELRPLLWFDYLTPRFYLRAAKRLMRRIFSRT